MPDEHVHQKVYDNFVLATYPASRRWICKVCLEEGKETLSDGRPKGEPSFAQLLAMKRTKGATP